MTIFMICPGDMIDYQSTIPRVPKRDDADLSIILF